MGFDSLELIVSEKKKKTVEYFTCLFHTEKLQLNTTKSCSSKDFIYFYKNSREWKTKLQTKAFLRSE